MSSYPRTEREARARVTRKLNALKRQSDKLLYEAAGMFEEGPVSTAIDMLLEDIHRGIEGVREAVDDEIRRHEEEEGYQ